MLLQFLSRLADFVTNNRAMIPWPKSEDPSAGKLAAEMANYVSQPTTYRAVGTPSDIAIESAINSSQFSDQPTSYRHRLAVKMHLGPGFTKSIN